MDARGQVQHCRAAASVPCTSRSASQKGRYAACMGRRQAVRPASQAVHVGVAEPQAVPRLVHGIVHGGVALGDHGALRGHAAR